LLGQVETGGALDAVGLELLLDCVLRRLGEADQAILRGLDADVAAALCRRRVTAAIEAPFRPPDGQGGSDNGSGDPQPGVFQLRPPVVPAEDLTQLAMTAAPLAESPFDGDPTFERLFDAVCRVLHRRKPSHVLLTGERGVGKSTVVAELARRAATGRIPFLRGKRFVRMDARHIPPDDSARCLAGILTQVVGRGDLIVCLEGVTALVRGDRARSNRVTLLAALSRARCRFLASVTPREVDEVLGDDPDLAEVFTRVDVEEPEAETALKLLRHFARALEGAFAVSIDEEAVRQAVTLSANYILNDQLPAKALKILERVCEEIDYDRRCGGARRDRIVTDDVVRVVSDVSGVPQETLRGIAERQDYEQGLREVIFGQDQAVREVATELGLIKAGMTDADKPASVMLFLGQTGTGKTEMAKALARFYSTSKRLKTYTLGNCVEPHSVATIIGVPPGYVGNDQGGRLVNELNADPYCVFLLDEADKAHPDVLQPFLNLFDEGWVCDQRGVRAYANKSIFILTTNVGQRMIAEMVEQGKSREEITARMKEALGQIRHSKSERPVFAPEFLARIKRVIVFSPLDRAAIENICRRQVSELQKGWARRRGKRLEIPPALVERIAAEAHELNERVKGKEGGRIVRKLIAERIEARVQQEVSRRPEEYKASAVVALRWVPQAGDCANEATAAEIAVSFLGETATPAAADTCSVVRGAPGGGNGELPGHPEPAPAGALGD
jgi:ATP-dependent Clp protease ATP-binding subunit ClpA